MMDPCFEARMIHFCSVFFLFTQANASARYAAAESILITSETWKVHFY